MDLEKMLKLKKGSNYAVMNTIYHKPVKINNKWSPDVLSIILKDLDTGKKLVKQIERPLMEIYVAKPEIEIKHALSEIDINDTIKIDVPYHTMTKEIAKMAGPNAMGFFKDCISNGRYNETKELLKWWRLFGADGDIEDFYRYKLEHHFGECHDVPITKGFIDIEADLMRGDLDVDKAVGDAPINAVTIIDPKITKTSYTFILREPENPLVEEFENNVDKFIEHMHDTYDDEFGVYDYQLIFYDNEDDLIIAIFDLINLLKFDFVLIWNMRFDIRYLIYRLKELRPNEDITQYLCHKDFNGYNDCKFSLDRSEKGKLNMSYRNDQFTLSSYTFFLCQMQLFASVRKAKSYPRYKLDYIAEIEVGANKLSYSELGSIKTFPYRDFWRFIEYNIKDVLLQVKIEDKVDDISLLYQKCKGSTRYCKAFKDTIYIRNQIYEYMLKQNLVLGENQNVDYTKGFDDDDDIDLTKKEKFEGAVVGDPKLNMRNGIELIKSIKSCHVFDNVGDKDITSMYPTIIQLFNAYCSTQYGRVIMDKSKITQRELIDNFAKYDRGGKMIDDLELREPLLFCWRWLNTDSLKDIFDDYDQYRQVRYPKKNTFRKRKNMFMKRGVV